MGLLYLYVCRSCGYTAQVGGGRFETTMGVGMETVCCPTCRALEDVREGGRRCSQGHPASPWWVQDCPRCRARMHAGSGAMIW
jgi:hypothetical protein